MAITNIYNTSALFFDALIDAIDEAKSEILLEYYIFHRDSQVGSELITALERASERGVQVRLLLDGIGSLDWFYRRNVFSTSSTVQVFIFNPVPWPMVYFLGLKASSVDRFLKYWSRVNHRNHKKVAIIDQSKAFIGSMNIHEETFYWQEMGVQIDAKELTLLRRHFFGLCEDAMEIQRGSKVNNEKESGTFFDRENINFKDSSFLVMDLREQRLEFRKIHKKRLKLASKEICLVTPYFIPSFWLIRRLIRSAQKGVPVTILLSRSLDYRFLNWAIDKYLYSLVESGVQVFKSSKMVHAKIVCIDDWMHLGSNNLNQRGFKLDIELNVKIESPEQQKQVKQYVKQWIQESQKVSVYDLNQRPWFEKLMGYVLEYFRYFF